MRLRFRLPARLALAGIVAAAALPLFSVAANAASGISLTVHAGYHDVIKPGQWMPVTIDAQNTGGNVDGTLQVQESLNAQPGVTGLTLYQEPISLAAGATKRVRVYVEIDNPGATVTARIVQAGRVLASRDSLSGGSTNYLVGVLSDQGTTLDDFAAVHPASISARVVHLKADDLPDMAIPLRAFDILVIDDFASDGLTAAQRSALTDFVTAGGNLLLGSGAAWHKTLAGLPTALLPMAVSGTTVIDTNTPGGSAVEIASGPLTNGQPWLSDGTQPLLIDRLIGSGTVTLATFDWNQQPVAISSDLHAVLRQLLSRAIFDGGGSGQNLTQFPGGGGPGPFANGVMPSVSTRSGQLTPQLADLPGLDLPSLQLTAALVIMYVLLVGPINYLVLGRLHRRALAWVTIPVIAIVAAGGAYGTGVITKGRSVQINQVAIVHLQPGSDRAYQETYTGIIPPSRGDYVATVAGERLLISPIINTYGPNPGSGGGLQVDLARNAVTLTGMTAFSLGGYATEGMTSAPQIGGQLRLVNGILTGTIENHSTLTFTDAVLIAGDSYQTFGELKPGATASAGLVPKSSNPFGQPLFTRIYANSQYGMNGNSNASRESTTKSQVLSLLPTGGSFKGTANYANPMLVAWTHQSFQGVTVEGAHPRSTGLTAVVVSLPVNQIGTGPLPAGVVNSRIVDVVGDIQGSGPPGMLVLQNGSVTFEFAPPLAAGTHLTAPAITSQNPFSAKFTGPPGSATTVQGVTAQVWNWQTSTWSDINYQDNGTTALPDSAVDPATGAVRVRVNTNNGGFLAGSMTLSGTVQ